MICVLYDVCYSRCVCVLYESRALWFVLFMLCVLYGVLYVWCVFVMIYVLGVRVFMIWFLYGVLSWWCVFCVMYGPYDVCSL